MVVILLLLLAASCFADEPAPTATAPASTTAPPVSVHAGVDHPEVTIGDPIKYTVTISAVADTQLIVPVLSGAVGDFTITDFGDTPTRKENGRITVTRWYTLTVFETGHHTIPAPKVQYRSGSEEPHDVEGNEVTVTVTSLLAQDKTPAADIRDIRPPEEVPFDWRPYGIVAAALVAVALLGAGFYYLLNRPRRQYVPPPRPAHEIALNALNRLRTRGLIQEGKFEAYYVELSAIVRRYLEDGLHLRAPEMTTEEFLSAMARESRLLAPHRRLLADFLSQADLVKFARHLPTLKDSESAYEAARRFIDETRPSPPGATEGEHAAA